MAEVEGAERAAGMPTRERLAMAPKNEWLTIRYTIMSEVLPEVHAEPVRPVAVASRDGTGNCMVVRVDEICSSLMPVELGITRMS